MSQEVQSKGELCHKKLMYCKYILVYMYTQYMHIATPLKKQAWYYS